jgi:hypothetical protein
MLSYSTAFSIAMSGTEARLDVTWKDDGYETQKVESYLFQRPQDLLRFRQNVLNVIATSVRAKVREPPTLSTD